MSIVTRTGDNGTTGLFGGSRLPKTDPRIEAIGTVDELNAALGVALATDGLPSVLSAQILRIQTILFTLGADLAAPDAQVHTERLLPAHAALLEEWIASLEHSLPPLRTFILPGGSPAAAQLHLARAICRRAERTLIAVNAHPEHGRIFLNRLSDYLFLAARHVQQALHLPDVPVRYE